MLFLASIISKVFKDLGFVVIKSLILLPMVIFIGIFVWRIQVLSTPHATQSAGKTTFATTAKGKQLVVF